jgi:prepilin-type N-terminal cleavage/methylation domain-containing protein
MKRIKPGQRGFTLVEMIFVLAIILTLIAIFTPLAMDKLSQSKTAKAQADIDAIAAALTNFFSDLANFPSCEAADCDPLTDAANNLRFLAVGTGTGDLSAVYPTDTGGLWNLSTQDDPTAARNNAHNHVVANNPNANGTANEAGIDYKTNKWRGPYISKLGEDPFGRVYIVHIGAMQRTGCPVGSTGTAPTCTTPATGRQGWILSAGPDENLDTAPTATQLSGDDIGYIFFTQ